MRRLRTTPPNCSAAGTPSPEAATFTCCSRPARDVTPIHADRATPCPKDFGLRAWSRDRKGTLAPRVGPGPGARRVPGGTGHELSGLREPVAGRSRDHRPRGPRLPWKGRLTRLPHVLAHPSDPGMQLRCRSRRRHPRGSACSQRARTGGPSPDGRRRGPTPGQPLEAARRGSSGCSSGAACD